MLIQFLIWLAYFCGENIVGFFLKRKAEKLLGRPLDECEKGVAEAIDHANSIFRKHYGDRYGAPGSSFMDHEGNQKKLQRSTFPRGKHLIANNLNLKGFDGSPEVPGRGCNCFS